MADFDVNDFLDDSSTVSNEIKEGESVFCNYFPDRMVHFLIRPLILDSIWWSE